MSDDSEQPSTPPSNEEATPPPPPAPPTGPPPSGATGYGSPPPPSGYDAASQAQPDYSQPGDPQPDYSQPGSAPYGGTEQGYAPPPAVQPTPNVAGSGVVEDTGSAVIAHVLALFTGIIGTGIYYAVSNDKSPFVRHHVTEALNFSITLAIAWMATTILSFILIGLLIIPFLMLWGFIMPILAAVAANKGEWYRYPATLRLVKGPFDQQGGPQAYDGQAYGGQGYGGQSYGDQGQGGQGHGGQSF